ncbi:hypothetical protein MAJJADAN_00017 [Pseudomonas phage Amjad_SA]|nr:hypothetical protein MAJJADAN_00017 [Pseudomonas phage Amjad_SA]
MAISEITVQVSVKDIEPIKGLIALLAFHFDQLPSGVQEELRRITKDSDDSADGVSTDA